MNHRLYYCPILEIRKMKPRGVQVTSVRRARAGTPTQALLEHCAEEETKERERLANRSQRSSPLLVCPGGEQFPARSERAGHTAGGLAPGTAHPQKTQGYWSFLPQGNFLTGQVPRFAGQGKAQSTWGVSPPLKWSSSHHRLSRQRAYSPR